MPNNPLQFVTNGDDYIQDRDPGRKRLKRSVTSFNRERIAS